MSTLRNLATGSLTASPLGPEGGFNWVFLVEILICAILGLGFLFFFNRLFATAVSYAIRAWTWHKYRAYVDITSLQISILGGRIFLKNVRYHGQNITVLVHDVQLTWRYWLRLVQEAQIFSAEETGAPGRKSSNDSSSYTERKHDVNNEKTEGRHASDKEVGDRAAARKKLPCRISVKVAGVEAFIYNRGPGYDWVVEQTRRQADTRDRANRQGNEAGNAHNDSTLDSSSGSSPERIPTNDFSKLDSTPSPGPQLTRREQHRQNAALPSFLRLFPIHVECKRAAAALGNENTTGIIIAKVEKAVGTFDVDKANPLDLYRMLFGFDFEGINVGMKPNKDFKSFQLDAAQQILQRAPVDEPVSRILQVPFVGRAKRIWQRWHARFMPRKDSSSIHRFGSVKSRAAAMSQVDGTVPGYANWQGLARYLDDIDSKERNEWADVDYARASTLADLDRVGLNFYFDVPGEAPLRHTEATAGSHSGDATQTSSPMVTDDDPNGSAPPAYGMDLFVGGGQVTYGPWADRQRLNFQQVFFPMPYVDAVPTESIQPGSTRSWTVFNIFVQVDKDVTLRVPTKEPSKDEKWQGRSESYKRTEASSARERTNGMKKKHKGKRKGSSARRTGVQTGIGADTRPYGWMDIVVKPDSTVKYDMDQLARNSGYRNKLVVDAKATEITSSVNHGLLWRTGRLTVDADLSQPLEWNTLRQWPFTVDVNDLELFILRDHLFLIIDLVNDWSSGAPVNFYTFVPYLYTLNLRFHNFIWYLNVNDANIVNDPADFESNDFLTLEGNLDATLGIDLMQYKPVRNKVTFDVIATDMRMRMLSSSRSSFSTLLSDKTMAELPKLIFKGSYTGHMEEKLGLTDTLRMDLVGIGLTLKAYGFYVRQLVSVKENYFGDYLHFKTLEEFQSASDDLAEANIKTASVPKPSFINELDVILCVRAEDATILVPTNLYSAQECVRVELPLANLDLRILSYYLDMGLQISPVSIDSGRMNHTNDGDSQSTGALSGTQLFVGHVDLDGHRCFGLPFEEPAYHNQWIVDVGDITSECSQEFLHDLVMAGHAFSFAFSDHENALPLDLPTVFYDATFVHVRTGAVQIWQRLDADALLLRLDPVEVVVSDWSTRTFSQRIILSLPLLTMACVDARWARGHQKRKQSVADTHTLFQTSATIQVVTRAKHFVEARMKQQLYLLENDQRTHRAPFLICSDTHSHHKGTASGAVRPPAMPFPSVPPPLDGDGISMDSTPSLKSANGRDALRRSRSVTSLRASIKDQRSGAPKLSHQTSLSSLGHASGGPTPLQSSHGTSSHSSRSRAGHVRTSQAQVDFESPSFSNRFLTPRFPLATIEPDLSILPPLPSSAFDARPSSAASSDFEYDVDGRPQIDKEASSTSVFIDTPLGFKMFLEPKLVDSLTTLTNVVLPATAEECFDMHQTGVLGRILDMEQKRRGTNSSLEIHVTLPAAMVRVGLPSEQPKESIYVDVSVHGLDAMIRTRQKPAIQGTESSMSFHIKAHQATALVRSATQSEQAISLELHEILTWASYANSQSVNVLIGTIDSAVNGSSIREMIGVAESAAPRLRSSIHELVDLTTLPRRRLHHVFAIILRQTGGLGDPPFLSRSSYMLRAFPGHFRNQASWRMLMRSRYRLANLESDTARELQQLLTSKAPEVAKDSLREIELELQNQNWDIPNVSETEAFKALFDSNSGSPGFEAADQIKPLLLTLRLDVFKTALTTRSDTTKMIFADNMVNVITSPRTAPTGLMVAEENKSSRNTIQVYTATFDLDVGWGAFDLMEDLMPDVLKLSQLMATPQTEHPRRSVSDAIARHDTSVAVFVDKASLKLRTMNTKLRSQCENLKLSGIGTTQASERYAQCLSLLVNMDEGSLELVGSERRILQSLVVNPSLYMDLLSPSPGNGEPPAMNGAIAYREIKFAVEEQIPYLVSLVDAIVTEEARRITEVVRLVEANTSPLAIPLSAPAESSRPPLIGFALLAGELTISLSLIKGMDYNLSGTALSLRVSTINGREESWAVTFDFGSQCHSIITRERSKRYQQKLLDVPPANGHVRTRQTPGSTHLVASASVEQLRIDAAAIQGLTDIFGRSELKSVATGMQRGIEDIAEHVKQLMPEKTQTEDTTPRRIIYNIRLASLGAHISARAPAHKDQSPSEVTVGFGRTSILASNEPSDGDDWLLLPMLKAQIRDIGAELMNERHKHRRVLGRVTSDIHIAFLTSQSSAGTLARHLSISSRTIECDLHADTIPTLIAVFNHIHHDIKDVDLSWEKEYIRHVRRSREAKLRGRLDLPPSREQGSVNTLSKVQEYLNSSKATLDLQNIVVCWHVSQAFAKVQGSTAEDLIFSIERFGLTTRGAQEASLILQNLQVQVAKKHKAFKKGLLNSALMPEASLSLAYGQVAAGHSISLKVTGKPFDLRVSTDIAYSASALQRSIDHAIDQSRIALVDWKLPETQNMSTLDMNWLSSLFIEADFAGAKLHVMGTAPDAKLTNLATTSQQHEARYGRSGSLLTDDSPSSAMLKFPGIGLKVQYEGNKAQPTFNGEMLIDASSNMLLPNVVPLLLEVTRSVKQVLQSQDGLDVKKRRERMPSAKAMQQRLLEDDSFIGTDLTTIFGKTKVDLGLRIRRQEFGLTCQPIARIDAKASMDDLYITMNTVRTDEHGHFFALSMLITKLGAEVKHVYSRETTFDYDMQSIELSIMNSKHLGGANGVSAVLKINPTSVHINGKQAQDLMLFRDIWFPAELRAASASESADDDDYLMEKYQRAAAAAAFPWDAAVHIAELAVELDLGQSIGKSAFHMRGLWASQTKTSNFEQNLCIGLGDMSLESQGRMNGFIRLHDLAVRTSIKWPQSGSAGPRTPLVLATVAFGKLKVKAAFDYQAFAFSDIENFTFLMYNAQDRFEETGLDRLVAVVNCDKAYIFCNSTSPASALALYQAFDRLIQEKLAAYRRSLQDVDKHLRRRSTLVPNLMEHLSESPKAPLKAKKPDESNITLDTDVIVSVGVLSFGVFPNTFLDSQLLKGEAKNIHARFVASKDADDRTHSRLGMTLGQLHVALASGRRQASVPRVLDIGVDDVVNSAINARGGAILRVPKVVASMETWQHTRTNDVEYVFKSLFAGKIDVGWNLSRINYIKGMWDTHTRALAQRLGKALPESAVKIKAGPAAPKDEAGPDSSQQHGKITAEVNLPQSKYIYHATAPPVIETPQLRDMGEATPPLEWIGLHRERLPNVTHQFVIVPLLQVAEKVGVAYKRSLGSTR